MTLAHDPSFPATKKPIGERDNSNCVLQWWHQRRGFSGGGAMESAPATPSMVLGASAFTSGAVSPRKCWMLWVVVVTSYRWSFIKESSLFWVCVSTSDFWSKQNKGMKNDTLQLWRLCLFFLGAILRNLSELEDCGTVSMGSGKINLTPQKSSVEKARFCGPPVCCSPLSPALYAKKIWFWTFDRSFIHQNGGYNSFKVWEAERSSAINKALTGQCSTPNQLRPSTRYFVWKMAILDAHFLKH